MTAFMLQVFAETRGPQKLKIFIIWPFIETAVPATPWFKKETHSVAWVLFLNFVNTLILRLVRLLIRRCQGKKFPFQVVNGLSFSVPKPE